MYLNIIILAKYNQCFFLELLDFISTPPKRFKKTPPKGLYPFVENRQPHSYNDLLPILAYIYPSKLPLIGGESWGRSLGSVCLTVAVEARVSQSPACQVLGALEMLFALQLCWNRVSVFRFGQLMLSPILWFSVCMFLSLFCLYLFLFCVGGSCRPLSDVFADLEEE